MNLLFSGTIPPWQLFLLFAGLCGFTFWIYRQTPLRSPWHLLLPGCRCLAIGLLILMLFQPVLGRTYSTVTRGRIPVIVDTSGSMSISDRLPAADQIELAWQFHMFPRELRDTSYLDATGELDELQLRLREISAAGPVRQDNRLRELRNSCKLLSEQLTRINPPPAGHDLLLQNLTESYGQLEADQKIDADKLHKVADRLAAARSQLPALQAAADTRLAASDNPEIAGALAEINRRTRLEWARELLLGKASALIANLKAHGPVDLYTFAESAEPRPFTSINTATATLPATATGTVIDRILNRYEDQPLAAIVLLSDGNVNSGKPLLEVREQLADRGISLHAVGIGSARPPKDLAIERIIAPESAFKDDTVTATVLVHRPGYEQSAVKVTLFEDDQTLAQAELPPDGAAVTSVTLTFKPENTGPRNYQVRLATQADEAVAHNNVKDFAVNILKDPIRILFLDEFPRWESRYAGLALQRDPRVELDALFADVLATQPAESRQEFMPASRDALFAYDVVVLGDVNPHHFAAEQLENLRAFVVERGGSLVLLAGEHHLPNNYRATVLNDILPFRDSRRPGSAVVNDRGIVEVNLDLRETFANDPLVQIGSTPASSRQLWRRLPGMIWVKSALAPAAVADERVHTSPQDWPVMLTSTPGSGKVLYLGSDSFWRWRYRAKWTYHQRLWSQVLLWATRGRTTGSDPFVKLMTDRVAYAPGEVITLKARVLDQQAQPLNNGTVSAGVYHEQDKLVRSVPFAFLDNSAGEYRADLRGLPRGTYRITPQVSELADVTINAAWEFEVRDLPTSEYVQLAIDTASLQQLGSYYYDLAEAPSLVNNVTPVTLKETHRADLELWNSFWMLALIALLLGFEWQMRKKNQLV